MHFLVYVCLVEELGAWFWIQRPSWPRLGSASEFTENFTIEFSSSVGVSLLETDFQGWSQVLVASVSFGVATGFSRGPFFDI